MIQLYGLDHIKLYGLRNYKDLKVERTLEGEEVLSFLYLQVDTKYDSIKEETYIRTKRNEYVVKEINIQDDWSEFVAKINLEEIKGKIVDNFETVEQTCNDTINLALAGTNWTIGSCDVSKKRTIIKANCSAYDILQEIRNIYRCDFKFDAVNKKIYVYQSMGNDKGAYFSDELNLKKLGLQSNSHDFCTRIIPRGKDGLSIKNINGGKEYVENYQYSTKVITIYWEDNRYTNAQSLLEDAKLKLDELSKPIRAYSAEIFDLANMNDKYKNILDYDLGDTITLLSKDKKIKEKQRIVKIIEYPDEPERNSCEIANKTLRFEDIQAENQSVIDSADNVLTSNGGIDGAKIDSIDATTQIRNLDSEVARITNLSVINANINDLYAHKASIDELSATTARVGTLEATTVTIAQLNVVQGNINDLKANKANVTDLSASNGRIATLESKAASIDTLLAGNISVSNLQAGLITADSGLISNGAIKDAMIADLSASKITAGTINGANINVINLNADNITVGKLNGQLLKDGSVSGLAVSSGAIDNSKVASNAAIEGSKLNISSVVTAINSGSMLLTSNKINIDADNGTLDVAFKNLKNTVTSTSNTVSSQGTSISTIQGQISSKIWQQDITTAVNNVQIGGRNLLLNCTFSNGLTNWNSGVLDSSVKYLGYNTAKLVPNTIMYQDVLNKVKPNTTYTVSCYAKWSNVVGTGEFGLYTEQGVGGGKYSYLPIGTFDWVKYIFTFTTATTMSRCAVGWYFRSSYTSGTVWVTAFKLEEGTKATDCTPAPEDIDAQISTINSQYSSLNQTVSDISANVGSLQTTTSNLGTRMRSAESSLSIQAGQIATKVSQTDINSSINAMQIGSRNLLKGTKNFSSSYWSPNSLRVSLDTSMTYNGLIPTKATAAWSYYAQTCNTELGKTYTLSAWVRTNDKDSITVGCFTFSGSGEALYSFKNNDTWERYIFTFTVDGNAHTAGNQKFRLECGGASDTKFLWVSGMKLEEGIKATDWTPALEDFDSQIDTVNTNYSTLNQTVNNINANVSSLQTTTNNLGTRMSNAESTLNIQAGQIATKVAQSDIDNSISNINIGGRNLIRNSIVDKDASLWNLKTFGFRDTSITFKGHNSIKIKTTGSGFDGVISSGYTIPFKPNTSYTFSLWAYRDSTSTDGDLTKTLRVYIPEYKNGVLVDYRNYISLTSTNLQDKIWTKFTATFTTKVDSTNFGVFFMDYNNVTGTSCVWISDIKLEEGNKATAWSPAPEDTQAQIDGAVTRISTSETNITQLSNSISLKVNTSDFNSLTGRVSNAESNITQLNNSISIKVNTSDFNSLTGRVSNTESNISVLQGQISSKVNVGDFGSLITQNANNVKIAVGQIGVNNIVRNSNFKLGFSSWWLWGAESTGTWYLGNMLDGKYRAFYTDTLYKSCAAYQSIHNPNNLTMNKNTNYYFSAMVYAEANTKGAAVGIEVWNGNSNVAYINLGSVNPAERKILKTAFSITTDFTELKFKVNHNGSLNHDGGYVVWLGDIMITQSDNYVPWCPSPDEVHTVNVDVSSDVLVVRNGNISIRNNNNVEVLKGDTNGNLTIAGDFTIGGQGGNVAYHTKDCSKWSKPDGKYALMNANGAFINNGGGERPIKSFDYGVVRPGVKNGSTTTIVLPQDFQGMGINQDFTVICTHGNIDSSAWAQQNKDAVRTIFINLLSWNRDTRELVVQPCLQKIGIATQTMWGWDANTTTPGNSIGEGAIDVIVFARI